MIRYIRIVLWAMVMMTGALGMSPVSATAATASPWTMRSIDNMHLTRDFPCWPESASFIASIAASERAMGADTSVIATPYDAAANYHQCIPPNVEAFEGSWVYALRVQGLHIWFRQTWFNWEGSYGAPKLTANTTPSIPLGDAYGVLTGTDTTSYMAKTYHFILTHPYLYADGDSFTPEAEPQNGGIRLSWGHYDPAMVQFYDWPRINQWMRDSMTVDTIAFRRIGKRVSVGNWGLPCSNYQWGGVNNIEPATINQMGTYVTDCYFHDVATVVSSLQWMHDTYRVNVVLGEWGDIWDNNIQPDTAEEIGALLAAVRAQPYVTGVNYWQVIGGGGGESLVDSSGQINPSGEAVRAAYRS